MARRCPLLARAQHARARLLGDSRPAHRGLHLHGPRGRLPGARLAAGRDFGERFSAHIAKSIAEAKLHTSWINPDAAYEDAVASFVRSVLDAGVSAPFLASLDDFVSSIDTAGVLNSLAQTL